MEGKADGNSQDSHYEPSGKLSPSNKESTPPIATPGNSQRSNSIRSIQKKIKEMTHQAFWDLLKEELGEDPPQYERALTLLGEIKEWLLSLLLPHQTRTQQEIKDKLDTTVIKQQIDNNTLDLHTYSQYIISTMARLCAPERDEKIRELTGLKDLIPLYKGIFETLELMKIDMANFTIRMSRPHIAACSAEYERKKFDDYLKVTPDGLRNTREWLWRNYEALSSELTANNQKPEATAIITSVLIHSFLELLEWDEKNPWPETLAMDQQRFQQLKVKLRDVEVLSSCILVTFNHNIGSIASNVDFRKRLKDNVTAVWGEDVADADINSKLPAISAQIIKEINTALKSQELSELATDVDATLEQQQVGGHLCFHSKLPVDETLLKTRLVSFQKLKEMFNLLVECKDCERQFFRLRRWRQLVAHVLGEADRVLI
uniref:EOG090X04Z9 n=1 Tax=Moina brachiata TaxID=675436 RepID=A0A4Y7NK56_9CRUS|nr:EOG090X04Z9 [Moina brachiata]SVE92976.1 EOG090X04Z9 [Moina brachiata]